MAPTSDIDEERTQSTGVLISGHDPVWAVGLCVLLGFSGLGMGALMLLRAPAPPAMFMLAMGGCLTVIGVVIAVVLSQRRRFLRPTDRGFVYTSWRCERQFHDDDVMCISLSNRENYFWGNLQSVTRRFIIWAETGSIPERIICISHLKAFGPDPLHDFIDRIVTGLHQSALEAYQAGERVEGDGWALERGQLMLKSNRSTAVIPLEELTAVETVDDHVNIWRKGQDLPIGRIPSSTANSHLLLLLFQDLMPERTEETEDNLPGDRLGRVIFERRVGTRTGEALGWLTVMGLSLLMMVAITAAIIEPRPRRKMRKILAAMIVSTVTLGASWLLSRRRHSRFRRHAFGIHHKGMFVDRKLKFSQIANISYVAVRRYSHGIYHGTTLTLRFLPMPSLGLKPISFSTQVQNTDAELDRLRDEVSLTIAARMRDFWKHHGTCPWMPYLQFQGQGLDYNRLTFTGRKQAMHIPFAKVVDFNITDGRFCIWLEGERKPAVSEETSQPNFFPGLMLFSSLVNLSANHEAARDELDEE